VSKSLVLETDLVAVFPDSEYCFAGLAAAQHPVWDQPFDRKPLLPVVEKKFLSTKSQRMLRKMFWMVTVK